jgi:hypothetical protein
LYQTVLPPSMTGKLRAQAVASCRSTPSSQTTWCRCMVRFAGCCHRPISLPPYTPTPPRIPLLFSVVVADFVTEGLPRCLRADEKQRTKTGMYARELRLLTGKQLAAKVGNQRMLRHILRTHCQTNWVWGVVSEFALDLDEIDSAGEAHGVMELVAAKSANKAATEMLLDSFMNGFIWRLFYEKWARFGRLFYCVLRALDVTLLSLLLYISFSLKNNPEATSTVRGVAVAALVIIGVIMEEEVRTLYLLGVKEQGGDDMTRTTLWHMIKQIKRFIKLHATHVRFGGMLCAAVCCLLVLFGNLAPPQLVATFAGENLTHARSLKRVSRSGTSATSPSEMLLYDEDVGRSCGYPSRCRSSCLRATLRWRPSCPSRGLAS